MLELATQVLDRTNVSFSEPQLALITPTYRTAEYCHAYFAKVGIQDSRIICFRFDGHISMLTSTDIPDDDDDDDAPHKQLYAITYPESRASEGKSFWQHTGAGISSRCAVYWLEHSPLLKNRQIYEDKTPETLPLADGDKAVVLIRERIARIVSAPSLAVDVSDITLYPTGMSAISNTTLAIRSLFDRKDDVHKVAVFGFVYRW